MSGVIVHTIPGPKPELYGHGIRSIVGITPPAGGDLWVPPSTRGPAYPDYSPEESAERFLALDETLVERLVSFFEGRVLAHIQMAKMSPSKWDCHSFALWMHGTITDLETMDLDQTTAIASESLWDGKKIEPYKLKIGELGIIGGRSKEQVVADHSVIGLEKGRSLQVDGTHGPLVIMNNERVTRAYKANSKKKFTDKEYGMYTTRSGLGARIKGLAEK